MTTMIARGNVAGLSVVNVPVVPVSVGADTIVEQTFTVLGVIAATDVAVSVDRNNAVVEAGLGFGGVRVTADNTIAVNFINNTAAPIVPTPGIYRFTIARIDAPLGAFQA